MSLRNMQNVLARILTDDNLRETFLRNPEIISQENELTWREQESLRNLDQERLVIYADGLKGGRIALVLQAFPLMKFLASKEIRGFTDVYCRQSPPLSAISMSPMYHEVLKFYRFFAPLAASGKLASKYARDILEYEYNICVIGNSVEASKSAIAFAEAKPALPEDFTWEMIRYLKPRTGSHSIITKFDYDVVELISHLVNQELPDLEPKITYLLFFKKTDQRGVRKNKITKATADLLSLCDGAESIEVTISNLTSKYGITSNLGKERLAGGCLSILRELYKSTVITFEN